MRRDMGRNDEGPLSLLREAVRRLVQSELRLGLGFDLLCPSCGYVAGSGPGLASHRRAHHAMQESRARRVTGGPALLVLALLALLQGCLPPAEAWKPDPDWPRNLAYEQWKAEMAVQQAEVERAAAADREAARGGPEGTSAVPLPAERRRRLQLRLRTRTVALLLGVLVVGCACVPVSLEGGNGAWPGPAFRPCPPAPVPAVPCP